MMEQKEFGLQENHHLKQNLQSNINDILLREGGSVYLESLINQNKNTAAKRKLEAPHNLNTSYMCNFCKETCLPPLYFLLNLGVTNTRQFKLIQEKKQELDSHFGLEIRENTDLKENKVIIADNFRRLKLFYLVCQSCFMKRKFIQNLGKARSENLGGVPFPQYILIRSEYLSNANQSKFRELVYDILASNALLKRQNSLFLTLQKREFHPFIKCIGIKEFSQQDERKCISGDAPIGFTGARWLVLPQNPRNPVLNQKNFSLCHWCFLERGQEEYRGRYIFVLKMRPELQYFSEKSVRDSFNENHKLFQDTLDQNKEKKEGEGQEEDKKEEWEALEDNKKAKDSYDVNVSLCYKVEHGVFSKQHLNQLKQMHEKELRKSQVSQIRQSGLRQEEEEKKEDNQPQQPSDHKPNQVYKYVNGFFKNATVTHNHHDVKREFTIIRVDARNCYQKWIGQTLQYLDKLLVMSHPYILPLKGFLLVDPTQQENLYLNQDIPFDNYAPLRKRYLAEKTVLFFAPPQVTNLECLLEEKQFEKGKHIEVKSYLEKQFPLFWRVKSAIRFLIAVHYLYKFGYGHHNLENKFLLFDEYGHLRLLPPLQPLPRMGPKDDMRKCGMILRQLLAGVSKGKEEEIFHGLVEEFLTFHNQSMNELLKNAIHDMRLMDATFSEYLYEYKNGALAKEVLSYEGFMKKETKERFLKEMDDSYKRLFAALAPTEFFYKK